MSERDQDALLDRLEVKKRRSTIAVRLLIGLGCVAVAAAIGLVLWALR